MHGLIKALVISIGAVTMVAAPLSAAHAQRWRHHHHYGHRYHHYHGDSGAALGVIGLATGAIIGSAIANSEATPEYVGPIRPWTDAWYQYCARSYRSFNPRTGDFTGYDGRAHFCVAR